MAAQMRDGTQHADARPAGLAELAGGRSERHDPAVDMRGQGAGQLERVPFAPAEQAL
jgi:hypothetical protein